MDWERPLTSTHYGWSDGWATAEQRAIQQQAVAYYAAQDAKHAEREAEALEKRRAADARTSAMAAARIDGE